VYKKDILQKNKRLCIFISHLKKNKNEIKKLGDGGAIDRGAIVLDPFYWYLNMLCPQFFLQQRQSY
jgi:hypothetical protein